MELPRTSLPRVTVIVPCFNYGHLLLETLRNVQEQTFQQWECIVVDDGSTDNTASVAQEIVQQDERFRYIYQVNAGLSAARNTGIRESQGAFIQLLDADDLLEKEKLKTQIAIFDAHPETDIVYSEVRYFNTAHPTMRRFSMQGEDLPWMLRVDSKDQQALKSSLITINLCVVNAPLIRKDVFNRIGEFNTQLHAVEDWEFWCRCAYQGIHFRYDNSPETLALVRLHDGSMSRSQKRMYEAASIARVTLANLIEQDALLLNKEELKELNKKELTFLYKSLFEIYKEEKNKPDALKHLKAFGSISNETRFVIKERLRLFMNGI